MYCFSIFSNILDLKQELSFYITSKVTVVNYDRKYYKVGGYPNKEVKNILNYFFSEFISFVRARFERGCVVWRTGEAVDGKK